MGVFLNSGSYIDYERSHNFEDISLMSLNSFYSYIHEIVEAIYLLEATISLEQVASLREKEGFALVGDGSWAVRRNANQGTYTFEVNLFI